MPALEHAALGWARLPALEQQQQAFERQCSASIAIIHSSMAATWHVEPGRLCFCNVFSLAALLACFWTVQAVAHGSGPLGTDPSGFTCSLSGENHKTYKNKHHS